MTARSRAPSSLRACARALARLAPIALLAPAIAMAAERPIALDIPAGKIDEICLPLKAGETLHWRFEASVPVDFNLHRHIGKKVVMPVDLKATREHSGSHVAEAATQWCLMWTAPKGRAARVTGGFAGDDVLR